MSMKLRFFALVFVAVLLAALPVLAQDGAIKIINDDGSVTEFKIPKNESAMRVVPPSPEPAMESEMEEFAPASPPPAPREKDKPLERRDFLGRVLKYEGKKAASASAAAVPVTEAVKEMPKKAVAAVKPAKGMRGIAPVPARKPERTAASDHPGSSSAPADAPGTVISQNEAVGIAISHAPPARDFKVFRAMHDNSPVYAIVFKTDKGDFEVLVDAYSGNVVKK